MNSIGVISELIEKQLLDMHTAYIGRVVSAAGEAATVQPLCQWQQAGGAPQRTAVVPNVPVAQSARYRVRKETLRYVSKVVDHSAEFEEKEIAVLEPLAAGDLVICVCSDRDITAARRGQEALPGAGHHSLSDSIIVGVVS